MVVDRSPSLIVGHPKRDELGRLVYLLLYFVSRGKRNGRTRGATDRGGAGHLRAIHLEDLGLLFLVRRICVIILVDLSRMYCRSLIDRQLIADASLKL